MKNRKIFILLTNTGTLFTNIIKCYTKKPYNHASISFDSNLNEVYSFGRKAPRNPFIGGFVKENTREGLFKEADCTIYSVQVTEEQYDKLRDFIRKMEAEKQLYRYNLIGLIGFLIQRPIHRKRAFFCSQFVATVLKEAGIADFDKPTSLVAPNDLSTIPSFQLIFEGKLNAYLRGEDAIDFSIGSIVNAS